jgi:uncharacterized protein (TIGR00251 family)
VRYDATRVRLRVSPSARRPGIVGRYGDAWKIRVAEPPEDGRANDAVIRLLEQTLGVEIRLVAGRATRDKVVALDLDEANVERLLAAAAGKGRE